MNKIKILVKSLTTKFTALSVASQVATMAGVVVLTGGLVTGVVMISNYSSETQIELTQEQIEHDKTLEELLKKADNKEIDHNDVADMLAEGKISKHVFDSFNKTYQTEIVKDDKVILEDITAENEVPKTEESTTPEVPSTPKPEISIPPEQETPVLPKPEVPTPPPVVTPTPPPVVENDSTNPFTEGIKNINGFEYYVKDPTHWQSELDYKLAMAGLHNTIIFKYEAVYQSGERIQMKIAATLYYTDDDDFFHNYTRAFPDSQSYNGSYFGDYNGKSIHVLTESSNGW